MIPPLFIIANRRSPIYSKWYLAIGIRQCSISSVRQHRHHTIVIGLGDEHIYVQMELSLIGLLRQDVPRMRVATLNLSSRGQPHSLGGAFVCFQFWHCSTLSSVQVFGRRSLVLSLFQRPKAEVQRPISYVP
jgi:hypothetical protein